MFNARNGTGLIAIIALVLAGCTTLPSSEPAPESAEVAAEDAEPARPMAEQITLDRVEVWYDNIHPSFWRSGTSEGRLFMSYYIYLTVPPELLLDVEDYVVRDGLGRTRWTRDFMEDYDRSSGRLGGFERLWSNRLSDSGSVMPIEGVVFEINFSDGSMASIVSDVPGPGLEAVDARVAVTEDYRGIRLDGEVVEALRRPEIISARFTGNTVDLEFTNVDRRAATSYVAAYTIENDYIGQSEWLLSPHSLEPRDTLNGGSALRPDGQVNFATIAIDELIEDTTFRASDIHSVVVVIRDGAQFLFTERTGDYLYSARSARAEVDGTPPR